MASVRTMPISSPGAVLSGIATVVMTGVRRVLACEPTIELSILR